MTEPTKPGPAATNAHAWDGLLTGNLVPLAALLRSGYEIAEPIKWLLADMIDGPAEAAEKYSGIRLEIGKHPTARLPRRSSAGFPSFQSDMRALAIARAVAVEREKTGDAWDKIFARVGEAQAPPITDSRVKQFWTAHRAEVEGSRS